jgi:hypothetical protein
MKLNELIYDLQAMATAHGGEMEVRGVDESGRSDGLPEQIILGVDHHKGNMIDCITIRFERED